MIDPDKLARSMVEATNAVLFGDDSPGGTPGLIAAAINERLADDEAMERARKALIADITKPVDSLMSGVVLIPSIRAAIEAAFTEPSS